MTSSMYQLYPVIALVALAAGTVWLERVTRADDPRPAAAVRSAPDFVAEHTRLLSFDATGQQRYELLAERIANYPFPGVTELEQPRLRYEATDGRELRMSAARGEVRDGGTEVFLSGEVRVFREGSPGNPEMTFASESLTVWPDEERAESREPVVLTQGATTAHGQGMRSDNLFGTLDLLGDVTVHIPRSPRTTP